MSRPKAILVVDIGGTNVKCLVSGNTEPRKRASGLRLTPPRLATLLREMTNDWPYDAAVIGFPGFTDAAGPKSEPPNLGDGWVGFDYAGALGCPVKLINDAALQALGSYQGGRMLFLGFGTGLGSAFIADKTIVALELGNIVGPDGMPFGDMLGHKGMLKLGKRKWCKHAAAAVTMLASAFVADDIVLGGGNAKHLKDPPPAARLGGNHNAFRGGFRLWNMDEVPVVETDGTAPPPPPPSDWRWF